MHPEGGMSAFRLGTFLTVTTLFSFVSVEALAVQALERTLEVRRPAVAARAGLPGHAAVKLGQPGRAFASAAADLRTIETASRSVVSRDTAFFRVPEQDLTRFRSRSFMDGTTYVEYVQQYRGLEVMDSRVSMIFRDGELVLSTRITFDDLTLDTTPSVTAAAAERVARESLLAEGARVLAVENAPELVVYPQESGTGTVARLGWRLVVKTAEPIGRFRTVVAADGSDEILQRKNLVAFDAAQILLEVEPRTIGDTPIAVAAKGLDLGTSDADLDGIFETAGGDVNVTVRGPWFTVSNQAATERTQTFSIAGGGFASYTWAAADAALEEVDSFYHSNLIRERQLGLSPDLGFLGQNFPVNVNVDGTCNAFFDGGSINFFPSGGGCNSTGRISDVVYHEYGHAIHFELTNGGMDDQIQEGVGDYFAHTLTDDPNLGPLFFPGQTAGIRNATENRVYPGGVQGANAEVHESGKIWTNTWWNLRNLMIAKHGRSLGVKYTDLLHTNTLRGNPTYPTSYAMTLAADDDDANLDNGTPNSCEITSEFEAHGLVQTARQTRGFLALSHSEPTPAGFYQSPDAPVSLQVSIESKSPSCGDLDPATVTLHYMVDGGAVQTVAMTGSGTTFTGELPGQQDGALVEYWFSAKETAVGAAFTAPLFAPANAYRYNVGALNTVFKDDFESESGWTHGGATLASHDDWERGSPNGVGFWDPEEAFSGSNVFGNDIGVRGGNGLVESAASSWLESPAIDCTECENTRLQFRRWLSGEAGANGDVARVLVNGTEVWSSAAASGLIVDRHWELVDLPIADLADGKGEVKVRFEHSANGALELGGWAVDDVSLLATSGGVPPGEEPPVPGAGINGTLDGGCTCSLSGTTASPNGTLAASLLAGLAVVILRRRR